ncbi:MAG: DUF2332 domain-containing protein [Caldilinea sp.]
MHYDRPNPPATDLSQLAERFRLFAATDVEDTSPFYHQLAMAVAGDADLLALAANVRAGQPPANMLLGAVHFLLLQDPSQELAHYFSDLVSDPRPPAAAAPAFRAFCLKRREEIAVLLRTRLVQTNELRRCAYLLPAFSFITALARQPLALIEVGASAGLNLLFDRYAYRYALGDVHLRAGDPFSSVNIDASCRVHPGAELLYSVPPVERRIGIDLNPVNLAEDDEAAWLRALIWPEHADRVHRLQQARDLWLAQPPVLIRGDAVETLPALLDEIPSDVAPVVFHTHVLNQFTPTAAAVLEAVFWRGATHRTIYRLGNDLGGGTPKQYLLRLRVYQGSNMQETVLGHADGHARQIEWLAHRLI